MTYVNFTIYNDVQIRNDVTSCVLTTTITSQSDEATSCLAVTNQRLGIDGGVYNYNRGVDASGFIQDGETTV